MRSIVFGSCLLTLIVSSPATAGNVLIKPEEAALPPAVPLATGATNSRALTRRPEVILVSPDKSVNSPFALRLNFHAHGGSRINPSSFHLIYLKTPNVDLTARVAPYVKAQGLDMTDVEAPPGLHVIKAVISDSENREGSTIFTLSILK